MATLKPQHQRFIVTRLARYDSPSDVQAALSERFDVEASRSQVTFYNPSTANGADRLAERWKDLFHRTRERYSEDLSSIAAAQKGHRIRMLDDAAKEAKEAGDYALMADLLEQVAKETGGQYTNRHLLEHSGRGGGPIQHEESMTIEEWRQQQDKQRSEAAQMMERFTAGNVDELEEIESEQEGR
jgi:hypothetical protein